MTARRYLWIMIALWVMAGVYILYRQTQMDHLQKTALSPSSSTEMADSAITKLGQFRGSRAVDLLVQIAIADREFIDNRQELAIQEVAGRADPSAIRRLSMLLQPFNGLARREAVALALERNTCDEECDQYILHYLERYWCGLGKWEDTPSIGGEEGYAEMKKAQVALADRLHKVLAKNQKSTLHVLRVIYGLGSPQPSTFALEMVEKLTLRGACPYLERSRLGLLDSSKEEKLKDLESNLRCSVESGSSP
jgi:hypothetical protein